MKCPACTTGLIVLEVDSIELDHCTSCGGVWLDAGELEFLLGEASNRDALMAGLKSATDTRETKIRCPICSKKMDKVACGDRSEILLDMCRRGHGLWFDRGELQAVIEMGHFPAGHRIYEIIRDIFGGIGKK